MRLGFFFGGEWRRGEDTHPSTHTHTRTKKSRRFPFTKQPLEKTNAFEEKNKKCAARSKNFSVQTYFKGIFSPLGFSLPTISNAFFADHGWEPACIFWPDLNGTFSAWPNWSCAASACENHGMRAQLFGKNGTETIQKLACTRAASVGNTTKNMCAESSCAESSQMSTDVFVLVATVEEVAVGNCMLCTLETLCLCTQTRTRRRLFLSPIKIEVQKGVFVSRLSESTTFQACAFSSQENLTVAGPPDVWLRHFRMLSACKIVRFGCTGGTGLDGCKRRRWPYYRNDEELANK